KTVCVPRFHSGHARHPAAASRNEPSVAWPRARGSAISSDRFTRSASQSSLRRRHRRCFSSPMAKPRSLVGHALESLSRKVTRSTGSSGAFALAVLVILVWGVTGPLFHFCDTWQLVINTGTTIVTFLMVFLIQRAQNKESQATQLKLNEIVAALDGASARLV